MQKSELPSSFADADGKDGVVHQIGVLDNVRRLLHVLAVHIYTTSSNQSLRRLYASHVVSPATLALRELHLHQEIGKRSLHCGITRDLDEGQLVDQPGNHISRDRIGVSVQQLCTTLRLLEIVLRASRNHDVFYTSCNPPIQTG